MWGLRSTIQPLDVPHNGKWKVVYVNPEDYTSTIFVGLSSDASYPAGVQTGAILSRCSTRNISPGNIPIFIDHFIYHIGTSVNNPDDGGILGMYIKDTIYPHLNPNLAIRYQNQYNVQITVTQL